MPFLTFSDFLLVPNDQASPAARCVGGRVHALVRQIYIIRGVIPTVIVEPHRS